MTRRAARTILDNTIFALNTDSGGPDDVAGFAVSSASGYNLVGVDETQSLINGRDGNLVGVADPGLDPDGLQNHGGPTPTIALLPSSPAIDAGSNALAVDPSTGLPLTSDQRGAGFPRIVSGTVDIGAFERSIGPGGPTLYVVTNTSDNPDVAGSLPWAIGLANDSDNSYGTAITFNIPTTDSGYNVTTNTWTITLSGTLELSESIGSVVIRCVPLPDGDRSVATSLSACSKSTAALRPPSLT